MVGRKDRAMISEFGFAISDFDVAYTKKRPFASAKGALHLK